MSHEERKTRFQQSLTKSALFPLYSLPLVIHQLFRKSNLKWQSLSTTKSSLSPSSPISTLAFLLGFTQASTGDTACLRKLPRGRCSMASTSPRLKYSGCPFGPHSIVPSVPKFMQDELREELGMDKDLPAVLLMGGGEGMGPVKKTVQSLGESLFDEVLGKPIGQLIIVCGRNKVLASSLEMETWDIPVKVRGFETQMEKWMGACDCTITKDGLGTISEALIKGLPIILIDYIPVQKKGNVPYVVDNRAGVFTRIPTKTARFVLEWFTMRGSELKRMLANALRLAQPNTVFDIVKDIHKPARERVSLANIPYVFTSSFTSFV